MTIKMNEQVPTGKTGVNLSVKQIMTLANSNVKVNEQDTANWQMLRWNVCQAKYDSCN
jgi:hypothetical protein